eukprot:5934589-Alexandrium_andersonii.AAC.1
MAKDCADCGLADWSSRVRDFAASDPSDHSVCPWIRYLHAKRHRAHPLGASGTNFEAALGPA